MLVDAAVAGPREAGDEVGAAVGPVRTLELAAPGDLTGRELLADRGGRGEPVRDRDPGDVVRRPDLRGGGQVGDLASALGAQHGLERARGATAVGERQGAEGALARLEAGRRGPAVVEAVRSVGVLGEVDGAGRVDGYRLVRVAAQELQRDRVDVGVPVERVDLEHPAVVLLEHAALALLGLLAGQPRVPRGAAAGAVVVGAGEADVLADPVALLVDDDVRRPAPCAGVEGQAVERRHAVRLVAADLVVVDQNHAGAVLEHGRAVGVARRRLAALEQRLTGVGDDLVREAGGQREQAGGVGDERAVPGRTSGERLRLGHREGVDASGDGDAEAEAGTRLEHAAAREG